MRAPVILLLVSLAVSPPVAAAAAGAIDSTVEQLRAERDRLQFQMLGQQAELIRLRAAAQAAPPSTPTSAVTAAPSAALESGPDRIAQLQAAIRKGEAASGDLRIEIGALEAETKRLTAEKQHLLNVQTTLTSGLIGALITATVAILGALSNFRRSRADRDFRRLEVIEKAHALLLLGLSIPPDVVLRYFAGVAPSAKTAKAPASPNSPDELIPNPSIEGTASGLRPPAAPHVTR
jgi:hypothetical protein